MKKTFRFLLRRGFYYKVVLLYYYYRFFPMQRKVVASTMRGRRFGDNPGFIIECLKEKAKDIDYVWLKADDYDYVVPDGIRTVSYKHNLRQKIYECATAKVWIYSHRMPSYIRKRRGQIFIETWHGGLGIKKIEGDVPSVMKGKRNVKEIKNTSKLADVFISNSKHLDDIYRRAFGFMGPIYKCGYPKNDVFFKDNTEIIKKVRNHFGLEDEKLLLYAPTFRDSFELTNMVDVSVYNVDYNNLKKALISRFGGKWIILVRWHPIMRTYMEQQKSVIQDVIDATSYPEMQELILASDVFLSDYSSSIFDAALREIPCFTFATDFNEYKKDRGVYYEMEELPFPCAKNNEELINHVLNYDHDAYIEKWKQFAKRTGLFETGHAADDISNKIIDIMNGKKIDWV